MKDMNTQKETKVNQEILKSTGKVQNHFPTELRPYDPTRPEGSAGIVAQHTKPVHFEFGIELNNSK